MSEKRFTEEEARRIFARVAERQVAARESNDGLTLAEIQEAARASGLDPALVAAVAAEMVGGAPEADTPTFLGVPLRVRQTRVLPVEVDDDGWARIVTELRRTFDSPGVPTDLGRTREWSSTTVGHGVPIHVSLTPGEGTTTVTVEQSIARQARGAEWMVPLSVGPAVILAGLLQGFGATGPEVWSLPAFLGLIMAAIMGVLWLTWRNWERKTGQQFERAMDRVEIAARDASASGQRSADSRETPRLSLDDLPEADIADPSRTRSRTRT